MKPIENPSNCLRALRLKKGVSFQEIYDKTGIHEKAIVRAERSKRGLYGIGLEKKKKLADMFGVKMWNLLDPTFETLPDEKTQKNLPASVINH